MSETPSRMLPLGTIAPPFSLPDTVSGNDVSLGATKSKIGTVVMFICNHCPFVIHIQDEMVRTAKEYQAKDVAFIAISSNDVTNYPQDSPEKMKIVAQEKGYSFPYLYDESQEVAKVYEAACTPDFYVFDAGLKLYYRGRMDDSRPGNYIPVTAKDLRGALDRLINGQSPPINQLPSIGCNIKWK